MVLTVCLFKGYPGLPGGPGDFGPQGPSVSLPMILCGLRCRFWFERLRLRVTFHLKAEILLSFCLALFLKGPHGPRGAAGVSGPEGRRVRQLLKKSTKTSFFIL